VNKYALFAIVTIALVLLDQGTKWWVIENIDLHTGEIQIIDGFFSLVHTKNRGAAFGVMQGQMMIFGVFTVIAFGVIGQMLWQLDNDERFQNFALAMVASGTIGNGIDRLLFQEVTDFLRVYTSNPSMETKLFEIFGTAEWPSFNVADAAIVVGMIMFIFYFTFLEKDAPPDDLELEPAVKPIIENE
jgi:signal peptidase II